MKKEIIFNRGDRRKASIELNLNYNSVLHWWRRGYKPLHEWVARQKEKFIELPKKEN